MSNQNENKACRGTQARNIKYPFTKQETNVLAIMSSKWTRECSTIIEFLSLVNV